MCFPFWLSAFESKQVSFVSVTQQFNTASSMGRLVLNVLLSIAQFEREIIGERIRNKIAATRRKGKWTGGRSVLGYTVNADRKLVVVPEEANRVRQIFALYLELGSLLDVVHELDRRGWANKTWTNKQGKVYPPAPWTKTSLHQLLTNVLFIGRVKYKTETHPGEYEAIIDSVVWQQVQAQLDRNERSGGGEVRNRFGALLKGLLQCMACQKAMSPSHTKKGTTRDEPYDGYLLLLTELEVATLSANATAARIKAAGFPVLKEFDTFDFTAVPSLPKQKGLELARGDWVDQHWNCCLVGGSGTGKTHVATAIGLGLCRLGKRVRFSTAAGLVTQLTEAQQQHRLDRTLQTLERLDLLIVDELGYLSFSRGGAELLFQVFADRYERRSLLITSNLPLGEWGQIFQGERMTAALLDRLTHKCHIFEMNGESYRFKESMKSKREKPAKAGKMAK